MILLLLTLLTVAILFGFTQNDEVQEKGEEGKELKVWKVPNIDNGAEFYFSPDGQSMIGNAKFGDDSAHFVYTFKIDGTDIQKINDIGQDACSYYFPDENNTRLSSLQTLVVIFNFFPIMIPPESA